jgi:hypothetical protein
MRVLTGLALSAAVTLVATATGVAAADDAGSAGGVGHVAVVQAVPGAAVDVHIDGRSVGTDVTGGQVLGPYEVAPGRHRIDFAASGIDQSVTVNVKADAFHDVVLHLQESPGAAASVTTYRTPTSPIAAGKARVLVAHTAAVGAVDVRFDGQAVFTDVTNGEYAEADVPAGRHVVTLLPAGDSSGPLLGPLDVALAGRTITMTYAMGNADDGMTLVVHSLRLADGGSLMPTTIGTGSAGLAGEVIVTPFAIDSDER